MYAPGMCGYAPPDAREVRVEWSWRCAEFEIWLERLKDMQAKGSKGNKESKEKEYTSSKRRTLVRRSEERRRSEAALGERALA